jgi:NAD(P)-dependent dehydrogenase (short-subunit alcohol dehydrogenase family)
MMNMTTALQHSIGSAFGAESTAAEVIDGIDLAGTVAVVTGGYSGIGIETTRALSSAGATVIVPARRPQIASKQVEGIANTQVESLDLGDLDSVAAFASRLLDAGRSIDIVVDSAGIMATPETRVGPGWEAQFAINHLGHYALINRIWPLLAQDEGARVVSVSSRGHHRSPVRFDDPMFESSQYDKWVAYGQAKTANVLFAVQLDRLGQEAGVRALALHPGGILTQLTRYIDKQELIDAGWVNEDGTPGDFPYKTPEQGAATQVWCATSPQLDDVGGVYCEDCDVAEIAPDGETSAGVAPHAIDLDAAARLWQMSARFTGVDAFA